MLRRGVLPSAARIYPIGSSPWRRPSPQVVRVGTTLQVAQNLYHQSREREFVNLSIGYGSTLVSYFLGRLSQPKDARSGLYSDATAYGPTGDLGGRYFRSRASYAGLDAQVAALDVWNRCFSGDNSSALFQWNAPSDVLEGEMEQFGFEHSFLDAFRPRLSHWDSLDAISPMDISW